MGKVGNVYKFQTERHNLTGYVGNLGLDGKVKKKGKAIPVTGRGGP
jgi:hypothetical protein